MLQAMSTRTPHTLLHIDDDEDLVDAVTSRFKASGFRVAFALDGVAGVQVALMYPADAINSRK